MFLRECVNTKTDREIANGLSDLDHQGLRSLFEEEVRELEKIIGYKIDNWNI